MKTKSSFKIKDIKNTQLREKAISHARHSDKYQYPDLVLSDKQYLNKALMESFVFAQTAEGHDFWSDVMINNPRQDNWFVLLLNRFVLHNRKSKSK